MKKTLLIATTNPKKQKELEQLLAETGWSVLTLCDFDSIPDVVEDGQTFMENAVKKAISASTHSGLLTLADDSGLAVDALNGAPGVYSARYACGEESTDEENTVRVLREMEGIPEPQRTARFICAATLAFEDDILFSTEGAVEGFITHETAGSGGFGYDPIFFYPPFGKTLAQVSADQKHSVSHRGKAMRNIVDFLKTLE